MISVYQIKGSDDREKSEASTSLNRMIRMDNQLEYAMDQLE